ncbi:hypothetical protein [Nostoc sp. CCY 9925]|uniref:hypothetical protein n=1 Tax=Nostoc sp. CCY 9925 TaxID=3103865 RepID=UPI0039C64AA6
MYIPYMKLVNILLATTIGFGGCAAVVSTSKTKLAPVAVVSASKTKLAPVIVAQSQVQNVSAVMPASTEVTLKSGGSKFGKLTAINPKGRKFTLLLQNGKPELIPIAQVAIIRFWSIDPITGKRLSPLQGGEARNWSNIPLANVTIQPNGNRAEIRLPCVTDSDVCKRPIASYTVTELLFPDGNKVTLSVVVAR